MHDAPHFPRVRASEASSQAQARARTRCRGHSCGSLGWNELNWLVKDRSRQGYDRTRDSPVLDFGRKGRKKGPNNQCGSVGGGGQFSISSNPPSATTLSFPPIIQLPLCLQPATSNLQPRDPGTSHNSISSEATHGSKLAVGDRRQAPSPRPLRAPSSSERMTCPS